MSDTRTFLGRCDAIVAYAQNLADTVESWADFHNELFSPDPAFGLVAKLFPDEEERRKWQESWQCHSVRALRSAMIEKFGVSHGANPIYTGPTGGHQPGENDE